MNKKQIERRKTALKTETLRKLDLQTLQPGDLAQVIGGYTTVPRQTCRCSV